MLSLSFTSFNNSSYGTSKSFGNFFSSSLISSCGYSLGSNVAASMTGISCTASYGCLVISPIFVSSTSSSVNDGFDISSAFTSLVLLSLSTFISSASVYHVVDDIIVIASKLYSPIFYFFTLSPLL